MGLCIWLQGGGKWVVMGREYIDTYSQEEIELNPLKKHVFEVFAFLASLRHLVNISG